MAFGSKRFRERCD
jgi:hypothetical protein